MMGISTDGQASTFAEGRVAFLKAELGITDSQKVVWDAYAETIKRNLQSMQGMWQAMKSVFEAKTPTDRLDAQIASMETRLSALKEIKPALAKLYAALRTLRTITELRPRSCPPPKKKKTTPNIFYLSAEQKKKADEVLTRMACMM